MNGTTEPYSMSRWQKGLILCLAISLALFISFFRGGLGTNSPLDQLARRSLLPEAALLNGKPTVFEFYADWCEVCREMAPSMLSLEENYVNDIDVVLLNVDNDRWLDLMNTYNVNGIPQLNFFDSKGKSIGQSIGIRKDSELEILFERVKRGEELPEFAGISSSDQISSKTSLIRSKVSENNYVMDHG